MGAPRVLDGHHACCGGASLRSLSSQGCPTRSRGRQAGQCAKVLRQRFTGSRMPPLPPPFILGWEEWVALPLLGLPAIKAKIDTGARTSALHAHFVEPYRLRRTRRARFGVIPFPRRA